MRVSFVTKHAYKLTRYGVVNCYLVREGDTLTLIDGALKNCGAAIRRAAHDIGLPIGRILLTHAHEDHIGAVDAVAAAYPGVEVVASERSLPLLRRPADTSLRPDENRGSGEEKIKGPFPGMATELTGTIVDGDRFGSLLAIDTPGHTPDHVAFLDERDGTLFAGDALIAMGRLAVTSDSPWYFPQKNFVWSAPMAIDSARHLLDYPVARFACGHGKVREGGHPALRAALRSAEALQR